jgi:hypothetical protein
MELHLSLKGRIEPVFYMVVSTPRQELSDLAPLVAVLLVSLDDGSVLLRCPLVFLNVGIQVVVPTLSTLLSDPTGESLGYVTPVFCAKFLYVLGQSFVLLLAPGSLDHGGVENFLPSVKALHICSLI